MTEFEEWRAERDRALVEMDFNYVRDRAMGHEISNEMCELILHKSRYECTGIPNEPRLVSARWLREQGYCRMSGDPLLPEGELPK